MSVNFHAQNDFNNALYNTLFGFEHPTTSPILVNGNVTIGVGYDLNVGGQALRDAVYNAIGIRTDTRTMNTSTPPFGVTGEQILAERSYITRLDAAIDAGDIPQMNQIMAERAGNNVLNGFADNRHASFKFWDVNGDGSTNNEVRSVFDVALPRYQQDGSSGQHPYGDRLAESD